MVGMCATFFGNFFFEKKLLSAHLHTRAHIPNSERLLQLKVRQGRVSILCEHMSFLCIDIGLFFGVNMGPFFWEKCENRKQ